VWIHSIGLKHTVCEVCDLIVSLRYVVIRGPPQLILKQNAAVALCALWSWALVALALMVLGGLTALWVWAFLVGTFVLAGAAVDLAVFLLFAGIAFIAFLAFVAGAIALLSLTTGKQTSASNWLC
jgi:hypothetical protein